MGFAELTTIRRQREAWQREATSHFAAGQTEKALEYYERHHRLHLEKSVVLAMDALLKDWANSLKTQTLDQNLILAYQNSDVTTLNQLVRQHLMAESKLGQEYWTKNYQGTLKLAIGERLLFLENHWRYGIKNGQRGILTQVVFGEQHEIKEMHIELEGKLKRTLIIDPKKYQAFNYGYACTVHRAQGMTVENTFVFVNGRWNKNLSYVAMSRHKNAVDVYASETTFKTKMELKRGMSKGVLKDSILDYPLAFAQRRGVSVDETGFTLKQHLASRLGWMAQSIKHNFEQTFFPKAYWERKALETSKQQAIVETLERREDAKIVAAYVDANRTVGVAWEALVARQKVLGINEQVSISEREKRLTGEPTLKALREASVARDTLAAQIYSHHGKYTEALAIYDIGLEKIKTQAENHRVRERTSQYLQEVQRGRLVYRDKLAFEIYTDIKKHYGTLKSLNISLVDLKAQAKLHERKYLFKELSSIEKESFRTVEAYLKISKRAGQLWQQIKNQEKALKVASFVTIDDLTPFQLSRLQTLTKTGMPIKLAVLKEAQAMIQERNRLAAKIKKNEAAFAKALEFYTFTYSKLSENSSEQEQRTMQWAKERLERLERQAVQYEKAEERRKFLQQYLSLLKQQDKSRYALASEIIKHKRNYYGYVFEVTEEPFEVLRALHRDAKLQQRDELLSSFTIAEQEAFIKVEQYVEAKRALGRIWGERQASSDPNHPLLQALSNNQAALRDELAATIYGNPTLYQPILSFFKLKIEDLSQGALHHSIRTKIAQFKRYTGDLNVRFSVAKELMGFKETYFIVKTDLDLNWRQLQRYADYAHKLERLTALTLEERLNYQVALAYKHKRAEAGKCWNEVFTLKRNNLEVPETLFDRAIELNKMRNELAFNIREQRDNFDDFLFLGRIGTHDIDKHANAHAKYLYELKVQEDFSQVSYEVKREGSKSGRTAKIRQPYWDLEQINRALEARAVHFVGSLLGSPNPKLSNSSTYRYGKKGSLAVTVQGTKTGLWYSFESGEKGNLIGLIQYQLGFDFKQAVQYAAEWTGIASATKLSKTIPKVEKINCSPQKGFTEEQLKKIEYAKEIVENSLSVPGTLADKYLKEHRKIMGSVLDETFKFHPSVWEAETKQFQPALVVIARNQKDEVQAVQCIYLNKNTGNKLEVEVAKKTFGPLSGSHVLIQKGDDTSQFALAEGPETALSVGQSEPSLSVWAALSVSNFGKVPLPTGNRKVLLCADNDGIAAASHKAVGKAIDLLSERGFNVWCVNPAHHKDFNDVLKSEGIEGVKMALGQQTLVKSAMTLEDLIQNKESISKNSQLIVEFVEKSKQYQGMEKVNTLAEVLTKTALFEEVGKLATTLKENPEFSESLSRYELKTPIYHWKEKYLKHLKVQEAVASLIKALKPQDPIQEYQEAVQKFEKMTPTWRTEVPAEKAAWRMMNTKINQLSYIIQHTPRLQYLAKEQGLLENLSHRASQWQEQLNEKLALEMGHGRSINR